MRHTITQTLSGTGNETDLRENITKWGRVLENICKAKYIGFIQRTGNTVITNPTLRILLEKKIYSYSADQKFSSLISF
jgi:hypothetical protein